MNARAVLLWSAAALTIALATNNPVYRALVGLCALNLILAHGRGGVRLRPILIAVVLSAGLATLITVLLSHTGAHVLFTLPPAIPALGGPVTLEAVLFGAATGLGIAAAVISAATLTYVVAPHGLVDALPPALARSGAAVGTALTLIPGVARSATEIRDAQLMRGWRPRRARDWPDLVVPVLLTAMEDSVALAEAMEARGYGAGRRTHFQLSRWSASAVLTAVIAAAAATLFVALRITGGVTDWYPFPVVTAPAVSALGAACCLALAVPALLRWDVK
jgi:energy-coupling factor transport system permease protein